MGSGCKSEVPASATDAGPPAPPPEIRVSADRTDLVFTYEADGGKFETASSISSVPEGKRQRVVVTDLSLTPAQRQASRYVYVADLSAPRADGTFAVSVSSRYGFESTTASAPDGSETGQVVVYSASWCGVCQKAKQLLTDWRVPFVEKDVEASRKAAEELAYKAQRAGVAPRGVPVIDVAGELMLGLDEASLRESLRSKGLLKN